MPYTVDDPRLPDNVKALGDKKRRQWVDVWNSAFERCQEKNGDDCEGVAFRMANGVVFDEMAIFTAPKFTRIDGAVSVIELRSLVERDDGDTSDWARGILSKLNGYAEQALGGPGMCVCPDCDYKIEKERGVPCRSLECPECSAALVAGDEVEEMQLSEATKTVDGKPRPAGDFLVVDDPEKPSTWHLPVKVNGEIDRRLMGAAWAALHKGSHGNKYEGPGKEQAIRDLRAMYRDEDIEMPSTESATTEMADVCAMSYTPQGATSFSDLHTAEQADMAASEVHRLTYQFQSLISNIMADVTITDKTTAIESLAGEFVTLIRETLGEAMVEQVEPKENETTGNNSQFATIDISESSVGHVTRLVEVGDVAEGGSKPLLLEIAPIEPGWGNERDNNFYPADMLERDFAKAFDGVKMYETNHVAEETNNRNWVSTYIETKEFHNGAPIGIVGIHNPSFAQRVVNLYELEKSTGKPLLSKLECSIRGSGNATPGFELNGRKGKKVQELSTGHSIDWVSRAGAGGHAMRLLESEEEMAEQETQERELENESATQEAPVEEVQIEEDVQAEPGEAQAEPAESQEAASIETEPAFLSEADVRALVPDHLPNETKLRLLERQFPNEDEARRVIAIEIDYLMAVTNSGKPVTAGRQEPEPVVNIAELAEKQRERQSNINARWLGR
jgi:hypothetical protein